MIRNYLLSALRNLFTEKMYAGINTIGLAISLATCFVIYSWVHYETSYDKHFPDSGRIYRVVTSSDGGEGIASTYPMVKTRILPQFPEVEESGRLFNQGYLGSRTRVVSGDKVFNDLNLYYGDESIQNIFPFAFVRGGMPPSPTANAVIITQSTADKLFGGSDPIGQTIMIGDRREFEVVGVTNDVPANTHFHYDLFAFMEAHPWIKRAEQGVWSGVVFHTYVKLKDGARPEALEQKIEALLNNFPNDPDGFAKNVNLTLQPLRDIHLSSDLKFELEANGNGTGIYLFITIAALVLLVAVVNYTNLAAARHLRRFREVGVRKIFGASRAQLILQFLAESTIVTTVALLLAVLVVGITHPLLASFATISFPLAAMLRPAVVAGALLITVVIALLTGILPALALSGLTPSFLLRHARSASSGSSGFRKALVVFQFTTAIALTICTAITYKQVNYLKEAKLGYDLDHVIVLSIGDKQIRPQYQVLKTQLLQHNSIVGAAAVSQLPTDIQTGENIDITSSQTLGVNCVSVDPDFFSVMNVGVKQGRDLVATIRATDSVNHFVVNESALGMIGWNEDEVLKQRISIRHGNQQPGPVMGVVNDFHFRSLHHTVGPLVIEFNPGLYEYLLVKVKAADLGATIDLVANEWKKIAGGLPFDYFFLDQEYNKLYQREQNSSRMFIVFAIVALSISLLGLFGLSSSAAERRTKEIAVRKVLGANVKSILLLVNRDFVRLLAFAFVIAVPLGYFFMDRWLANFAFRTSVGPSIYIVSGALNLLLALFTLSVNSLRVSHTNPAEVLKHE